MDALTETPAVTFGADFGGNDLGGWYGCKRSACKSHLEADLFETLGELVCGSFRVAAIEVVSAGFAINSSVANEKVGHGKEPVCYCDGGLLHAAPLRNAAKQSGKETIFRTRSRPCALPQNAS